jgi:hypothetical protein
MSFGPCRSLIYLASFGFHEQLRIPGSSLPSIPGEFVECTGMDSSPIEIACRSGSLQFEKQYSLEDHSISNIMSAFQAIDSHTSASIVHQHYSHSVACMHDLHDAAPRIIGNSIDLGWILGPPTGGGRSIGRADVAHSASKTTGTWPCGPIDLKDSGCWHAR